MSRTKLTSSASLLALTLLGSVGCGQAAFAQADDDTRATALEEIVVVARRREENIQDVPSAVTAVSGEELRAKNIENTRDLALTTPSLNVGGAFTSTFLNFSMRGNIPNANSFGSNDPTVQTYFNEVAPIYPSSAQFFDIASVDVLRGPQGTLFGRTAIGGAVLFNAERPKFEFGGYVQGQFGNYENREFSGALNLPIVADKLALRVAGQVVRRDGYTKVLNLNNLDLDEKKYESFRASLLFTPTENIESLTVYNYSNIHQNAGSFLLLNAEPGRTASVLANPTNAGYQAFLAANPDLAALPGVGGGLQAYLPVALALGPRKLYLNTDPDELLWRERVHLVSNTTRVELGSVTVRNIVSYQTLDQQGPYNPDSSPLPILEAASLPVPGFKTEHLQAQHQFSEELQLLGKLWRDKIEWQVGGYYQRNRDDTPGGSYGSAAFAFAAATARQTLNDRTITSKALYAHVVFHATDKLDITGGIRRTWDDLTTQLYLPVAATNTRGQVVGPAVCANDRTKAFSYNEPACRGARTEIHDKGIGWVLSADYKATEDVLVYLTSRRGYQPAGINTTTTIPGLITFAQAKTTDFEAGLKAQGLVGDMAYRFNAAAFYQNLKDAHRSSAVIDPRNGNLAAVIVNAEKATVKGVEAEFQLAPTDSIRISGFADYTDANYKEFNLPVIGLDPSDPTCAAPPGRLTCRVIFTGSRDISDNPFPYLAKFHIGGTIAIDLPMPEDMGQLTFTGTYYHSDPFRFTVEVAEDPLLKAQPQDLVNLRLDWNNVMGRSVDISAFVRNATNDKYLNGAVAIQPQVGISYGSYGEPRMYGIQVRYRFGAPS